MRLYVVKVTQPGGDMLHPITVLTDTADEAVKMVRAADIADLADQVEARHLKDGSRAFFGRPDTDERDDGVPRVHLSWTWSGPGPINVVPTFGETVTSENEPGQT